MTGLTWLLLAMSTSVQPAEFHIETDTPDALCPELQLTRDAVTKRLGRLEVDGGGTWQGRYSTVHDPAGLHGDSVHLVITDPSGKEQLTRDLPMRGESCATMAQAIALVVDSFFRDFGQSSFREGKEATPAKEAAVTPVAPKPEAKAASQLPGQHTGTALVKSPAPPSRVPPRLGVALGGGYESVPSSAAIALGGFAQLGPHLRWDLRAAVPAARASQVYGAATAKLFVLPVRLSIAYFTPLAAKMQLFLGPEFLTSFEQGSGTGVANGHSGWRESFGLGGRTGAVVRLGPGLALAANFSLEGVLAQTRQFLVVEQPVLEVSPVRASASIELWAAFFP